MCLITWNRIHTTHRGIQNQFTIVPLCILILHIRGSVYIGHVRPVYHGLALHNLSAISKVYLYWYGIGLCAAVCVGHVFVDVFWTCPWELMVICHRLSTVFDNFVLYLNLGWCVGGDIFCLHTYKKKKQYMVMCFWFVNAIFVIIWCFLFLERSGCFSTRELCSIALQRCNSWVVKQCNCFHCY